MESDSTIDIFFKSLLYPFSRPSNLIEGTFIGSSCFLLVGFPVLYGYQVRCGRSILAGSDLLPDWEPSTGLVSSGFRALIIAILYGIVIYLVSAVAGAFVVKPAGDLALSVYLIATLITTIVADVITLPIAMMAAISLIVYVDTGDLWKALDPGNVFNVFAVRPLEFVQACLVEYAAGFIVGLPFTLLIWCLIALDPGLDVMMLALIPSIALAGLFLYASYCIHVYVWAKFYLRVAGRTASSVVGTPVP